jgi:hypothetical protein
VKLGVETVEGILVAIHNHNVISIFVEVIGKL